MEQAIPAKTKDYESNFHVMTSLPMMIFLVILLLPSMPTEGRVLTQTQKPSTISTDHKTNQETFLDKTEDNGKPGKPSIKEVYDMVTCAFNQDKTLLEDQSNSDQHNSYLSQLMTNLDKCGAQKYKVAEYVPEDGFGGHEWGEGPLILRWLDNPV
ncbi:exocrine gland-secreted peptide 1-like [Mus pahari]|uniref:exocrine gland-secreted peptide 1-like n=1 Tax=Mus pahari TaxID=10093 RepID=UPI000A30C638|nr:exocrine gland-secreted peptide 1-like [Mus pahari]